MHNACGLIMNSMSYSIADSAESGLYGVMDKDNKLIADARALFGASPTASI